MDDTITLNQPATVTETCSLRYLGWVFFKIGLVSFGGHMALVAMIQKELIERNKTINQEILTDGITIASLLPGPLAVNIVTYIGYRLKGKVGAMVCVMAVLLPAVIAMLTLTWCYFNFAYQNPNLNKPMLYTAGAVSGIILTSGFQIYKKEVKGNILKNILCLLAFVLIILIKSYLVTIILIAFGALAGIVFNLFGEQKQMGRNEPQLKLSNYKVVLAAIVLALTEIGYLFHIDRLFHSLFVKLGLIFSGISLSLFGGGYVMIPIMQSIFVNDLKWLTAHEFVDCIAFSQITPGPILVSCLFIGYKLSGFAGALLALLATFLPPSLLMIMISKIYSKHQDHSRIKNALAGIKPVVTGLILASAIKLLQSLPFNIWIIAVCVLTVLVTLKYKLSPVYLILFSLIIGVIFTFFNF